MNRKLLFVIFVLVAVLVLAEGGRRRRRRRKNCPRTDEESNGDHWCCDVKSWNDTRTRWIRWPCDESDTDDDDRRRRSSDHRNWWDNLCGVTITYNVTVYYNSWKCCEGWNEDDYGDCSIPDGDSIPVYCENGGTVIDSTHCACPEGFVGTHCETPVCTPTCQNNGHCEARDGRPICICPSHFTGDQCQTPFCERPCENGGRCVADICDTRCECRAGYVGRFCEIAIKEGDCPVSNNHGACYDSCYIDQDCSGANKCCYNGCGHDCMKPINSSRCVYKNHTYSVGEIMHKDDCTTCTCRGEGMSHDPSGFDCFTIDCFVTSCPDGMFYKKIPGQCCGQCEEIRCSSDCGPGKCGHVYGIPQCICPHNFRGDSCETPICHCQNGGTCIAQGTSTYCVCDPAYTGKHCEIRSADKTGVCPQDGGNHGGGSYCTSDWHCAGAEKCCSSSGSHICVPPPNPEICIHQNLTYSVGSVITKSNCMMCTCMGQGNTYDPSGLSCRPTPCPMMMECPPGTVFQTLPGDCCAKCVEINCTQSCKHGGHCSLVNDSPHCVCQENFEGDFCENAVCPIPCRNGGRCVAEGDHGVMCVCPVGFSGKYCETKLEDKKGLCPNNTGNIGICVEMCSHDLQCTGGNKCCSTGCGHDCVPALNPDICKVGSVTYRKNEVLKKSLCERCVCQGQGYGDDPSGFTCSVMMCGVLECGPDYELKTSEGNCCPGCEKRTIPLPLPKFKWCPSKITIEVNSYNRFVDLKHVLLPKLVAVDGAGQILPISLSLNQLEHCACPHSQQNIHNVVATSKADKNGKIASCAMAVTVKDVHPPRFTSCPTNFELFTTDVVTWDNPTVADNVGLHKIDFLGAQRNNTKFTSGSYMLGYIATDFEGNVAVCQFKVSIWEEDSTDVSLPHGMKKIQEDSVKSNKMFIAVGVAIGALITLAVVVVLFICCRKSAAARKANTMSGPPVSSQHGYDNGIYAIYGTPPPDFALPRKGKLPEYSSSEPPDYESVDPYPQESKAIENLAYVSTIDVKLDFDNKVNETLSE